MGESINECCARPVCRHHFHRVPGLRNIIRWIDLRLRRLFAGSALRSRGVRATFASTAMSNLENTIATFAIYGCPTKNDPTIAPTADSAVSAEEKTFATAKIVECASTNSYLPNTIARLGNTWPIVPFATKTYSPAGMPRTNCRAVTPFIGIVFGSWRVMIRGVPCAKRRRTRMNG